MLSKPTSSWHLSLQLWCVKRLSFTQTLRCSGQRPLSLCFEALPFQCYGFSGPVGEFVVGVIAGRGDWHERSGVGTGLEGMDTRTRGVHHWQAQRGWPVRLAWGRRAMASWRHERYSDRVSSCMRVHAQIGQANAVQVRPRVRHGQPWLLPMLDEGVDEDQPLLVWGWAWAGTHWPQNGAHQATVGHRVWRSGYHWWVRTFLMICGQIERCLWILRVASSIVTFILQQWWLRSHGHQPTIPRRILLLHRVVSFTVAAKVVAMVFEKPRPPT